MDIADTERIDWKQFRSAFEAAVEALVSAIPADLSPIQVDLSNNRTLEIKLNDSPMTRAAIACRDWFPSDAEENAAILRLWAFLALLPQIPSELLFEQLPSEESPDGGNIRDEAFIVASTIRLTRKGKLPRQKFINDLRAMLDSRTAPSTAMPTA